MSCPKRLEVEAALDGRPSVDHPGVQRILEHVEACPACARIANEIELLDGALAEGLLASDREAGVPPGLVDRMRRLGPAPVVAARGSGRVRRRSGRVSSRLNGSARPPSASGRRRAAGSQRTSRSHRLRPAPRRSSPLPVLVAVGVLLLSVGVVFVLRRSDERREHVATRETATRETANRDTANRGARPAGGASETPAANDIHNESPVRESGAALARTPVQNAVRDGQPERREPAAAEDAGRLAEAPDESRALPSAPEDQPQIVVADPEGADAEPSVAREPGAEVVDAPKPRRRRTGGILLPGEEKEQGAAGSGAAGSGAAGSGSVLADSGGKEVIRGRAFRLLMVHGALLRRRSGEAQFAEVRAQSPEISPDDELRAGGGGAAITLGNGVELAARKDSTLRLGEDTAGRGFHASVRTGSVLFTVAPDTHAGTLFLHTGYGEVRSTGGQLLVERESEEARVALTRGALAFTSLDGEQTVAAQKMVVFSAQPPVIDDLEDAGARVAPFSKLRVPEKKLRGLDFEKGTGIFKGYKLVPGDGPGNQALAGKTKRGDQHWGTIVSGSRANGLFTGDHGVVIRFRYFLAEPQQTLLLRCKNKTKGTDYMYAVGAPVTGRWATVEVAATSMRARYKQGQPPPDAGDVFTSFEVLTGKSGQTSTLLIDDLEILQLGAK